MSQQVFMYSNINRYEERFLHSIEATSGENSHEASLVTPDAGADTPRLALLNFSDPVRIRKPRCKCIGSLWRMRELI